MKKKIWKKKEREKIQVWLQIAGMWWMCGKVNKVALMAFSPKAYGAVQPKALHNFKI